MNSSAKDVNRRVLAIQAKKKRHKPNKKKDKPAANSLGKTFWPLTNVLDSTFEVSTVHSLHSPQVRAFINHTAQE